MKIIQINTVYKQGSTGKIAYQIQQKAKEHDCQCVVAYRYAENKEKLPDTYEISTWLDCHIHNRIVRITGLQGMISRIRTRKFLKFIREFNPDIIHLHNIHGSYLNHGLLFSFLKESNIPVVWTLHDCWAFTGRCPYFTMVKCDKWQTGCCDCPQRKGSIVDLTNFLWKQKRKWFTNIKNMTLVTPSQWLAGLAGQTFLNEYPVHIINNGIDLSIFSPTPGDFREKYRILNKFVVLGVAFEWGKRKGLDVFIELSKRLDESKYAIVLVGTDDAVDKQLPANIISIHRTQNQTELAEIYSSADVFVNPTREENFPTVSIEALACGTPVLTFDSGGSPEIPDETCGAVVDCDDIDALEREIIRVCENKPYSREACTKRASIFAMKDKYEEYINLYRKVIDDENSLHNKIF